MNVWFPPLHHHVSFFECYMVVLDWPELFISYRQFGFWFLTHALALQEAAARKWASSLRGFATCIHHSLIQYSRATCLSNTVRRGWTGFQLLCVFMRVREKMCKIENGHLDARHNYWATLLQRRMGCFRGVRTRMGYRTFRCQVGCSGLPRGVEVGSSHLLVAWIPVPVLWDNLSSSSVLQ